MTKSVLQESRRPDVRGAAPDHRALDCQLSRRRAAGGPSLAAVAWRNCAKRLTGPGLRSWGGSLITLRMSSSKASLKSRVIVVAIIASLAACTRPASDSRAIHRWLVGPTPTEDFVHAGDTEASLRQRLGAGIVITDSLEDSEGGKVVATVLFPADSTRRIEIFWWDSLRTKPYLASVRNERSVWEIYPGVHMETDLRSLERMNGRAFNMFGFEFDYAGTTNSFEGGLLDSLWQIGPNPGVAVKLRLLPREDAPKLLLDQVFGEKLYRSDLPAMRELNPRVYEMLVHPRPREARP